MGFKATNSRATNGGGGGGGGGTEFVMFCRVGGGGHVADVL